MDKRTLRKTKPIPGFPNYVVHPAGRIYNIKYGRELKMSKGQSNYLYATLFKDKKAHKFMAAQLVAKAFVRGFSDHRNKVRYKKGNKDDISAKNLEWCTHQEACKKGNTGKHNGHIGEKNANAILTQEKADNIRKLFDTKKYTLVALGLMYKVNPATIGKVVHNKTWIKRG